MGFEETLVGFEERFAEMVNFLCVLIGGVFMLFALITVMDFTQRATAYAAVAISFLLFPMAAAKVLKIENNGPMPPAVIKKKK
jgi:hypothetical protein